LGEPAKIFWNVELSIKSKKKLDTYNKICLTSNHMKFTTLKQAAEYVGGFSNPSKMPCPAWSTPAQECLTGSKLVQIIGTVCHGCYALKGNYHRYAKTVLPALYKRLETISKPFWSAAIAFWIKQKKLDYFRWHDSGDVQTLSHFIKICEIAKMTPDTKYWLPSREYTIISQYVNLGLKIPENLIVRLSAYKIEGNGPVKLAKRLGVQISTVKKEGYNCHAYSQGGKCLDCRACWDKNIFDITYKLH